MDISKNLENTYRLRAERPVPLAEALRIAPDLPLEQCRVRRDGGATLIPTADLRRHLAGKDSAEVEELLAPFILWEENFENLVTNAGLDDSLDKHLLGSSYTAAWYVGLTDGTPTPAAAHTMSSHSGWSEVTAYDEGVRQTLTLAAVSGQSTDNSGNLAVFTISTNSTTIGGAFIVSNSTKSGTTGVLYGVGAFTAGDKELDDGDTLSVQVTCTAAAS